MPTPHPLGTGRWGAGRLDASTPCAGDQSPTDRVRAARRRARRPAGREARELPGVDSKAPRTTSTRSSTAAAFMQSRGPIATLRGPIRRCAITSPSIPGAWTWLGWATSGCRRKRATSTVAGSPPTSSDRSKDHPKRLVGEPP